MIKKDTTIKKKYITFLITALLLITCISEVYADGGDINIRGRKQLDYVIDAPGGNIPADKNLTIKRKQQTEGNVYYTVEDYYISNFNLAEYIMARTPHDSDYQPLHDGVIFSREGDDDKWIDIEVIVRVDNAFWANVPNGIYNITMNSDKGPKVTLSITVEKSNVMIISPGSVNILADSGPGLYQGQETVSLNIDYSNQRWVVAIEAFPMTYQGNFDNAVDVNTSDIYMSIGSNNSFFSLDNIYRLYGNDYGESPGIDLYFQVDVGQEHIAGDYSGEILFTISEF
ncbi:MAG: hypothetical protein ACLFUI_01405 [Halanaerobiales bacterium]